jgi:UDP-GlcNAc:undecaprenyl-phosphate/decaprenyl-phosphate GlcNAc-1-phosphate transferase
MMTRLLLILAAAFMLAVGATPLFGKWAVQLGIVAQPGARRIHLRPIPMMGGVAMYLAFIIALLLLGDRAYVQQVAGILLGASLCSLIGLWDDQHNLRALVKLIGQGVAAYVLIISGVQVQLFPQPLPNILLTVLWVLGITNAQNLLDNMDGLSGGVAAIAAVFFLLLAAMSGQYLVGALAAALVGACVGFLVYNVSPASIFMGDAGSLFLGFTLAAVGIKLRFPGNVHFVTWMIPVMVLGLPIFDTTMVTISRLRRGLNPLTAAGKDHTSHRLVKLGLTQREAVLTLYLVCCALGVVAMFLTQATIIEGYVVGAAVLAFALYALWRMEKIGPQN